LTDKNVENGETPFLTEKFTATWSVSYKIQAIDLNIDYTGNVYSPMQLPLLSALDPRAQNRLGTVCKTFNSRILVAILNSMPELKPIELLPKQKNPF
jgi:outer membrane receptor for ferrienterochelin and colicins